MYYKNPSFVLIYWFNALCMFWFRVYRESSIWQSSL